MQKEIEFEDVSGDVVDQDDEELEVDEVVERYESGYRLRLTCKRGTGTNDRDEVKAELNSRLKPTANERDELVEQVKLSMLALRGIQPDGE